MRKQTLYNRRVTVSDEQFGDNFRPLYHIYFDRCLYLVMHFITEPHRLSKRIYLSSHSNGRMCYDNTRALFY